LSVRTAAASSTEQQQQQLSVRPAAALGCSCWWQRANFAAEYVPAAAGSKELLQLSLKQQQFMPRSSTWLQRCCRVYQR
jgi:hypothetical protein